LLGLILTMSALDTSYPRRKAAGCGRGRGPTVTELPAATYCPRSNEANRAVSGHCVHLDRPSGVHPGRAERVTSELSGKGKQVLVLLLIIILILALGGGIFISKFLFLLLLLLLLLFLFRGRL
jgi:hypothetical protein